MYAVLEIRTNENGVMTIADPIFKTPNPAYAESRVYEMASAAVTSKVAVHTILCIDEHGVKQFNTPLCFEHTAE